MTERRALRDLDAVVPSDEVRRAALFPESDLLPFPPSHPSRRERIAGVLVQTSEGLPISFVLPERMDAATIAEAVDAVRRSLRTRGCGRAVWVVPEAAEPSGLTDHLLQLGMRPSDEPGIEPRSAAMVAIAPPPPGPPDVIARPAESFEEYLAAQRITGAAFQMSEALASAFVARAERTWNATRDGGPGVTFVALVGGEVVAFAGAARGRTAVYMAGGGTRADRRGIGAYRALVRARWDFACAHGTPALTVGAGTLSQPILERIGFETVGPIDYLIDDIA